MIGTVCKLIGAAAVVTSAVTFGRGLAARQRAVVAQLDGFVALFRAIRSGIEGYVPIGEVLSRMDGETVAACSGGGVRRWNSLSDVTACTFANADVGELIRRAADELGRGYRNDQLKLCDQYIEALKSLREQHAKKQKELTGAVMPLLICAAVGAVILLI